MIVPKLRELAKEAGAEVTAAVKAVVATEIAKVAVEVVVNAVEAAVETVVETVVAVVNAVEMAKVAAEVVVNAVEAVVETVVETVMVLVAVAVDAPEPLLLMRRARLSNRMAVVVVDLVVIDSKENNAKMLTLWIDKTELDVVAVVIASKAVVAVTGEAIRTLLLILMTRLRKKLKIPLQPSKRRPSKLPPLKKAKRKKATLSMISLPKSLPNRLVF